MRPAVGGCPPPARVAHRPPAAGGAKPGPTRPTAPPTGRRRGPTGRLVHALVADRAAVAPGRPAVVAPDGALSYAELDDRANRLAWRLRQLGVRPGVLVGLCLPRSSALFVGALGILRAGGAYVP